MKWPKGSPGAADPPISLEAEGQGEDDGREDGGEPRDTGEGIADGGRRLEGREHCVRIRVGIRCDQTGAEKLGHRMGLEIP